MDVCVCMCSVGTSLSWTMYNLFFVMCRQAAHFKRDKLCVGGEASTGWNGKGVGGDPNVSVQYLWNEVGALMWRNTGHPLVAV